MPSCPTTSFARFHCLFARVPAQRRKAQPSQAIPLARIRLAPKPLATWSAACPSAPKNVPRTRHNNASRLAARLQKSIAKTRLAPIHLRGQTRPDQPTRQDAPKPRPVALEILFLAAFLISGPTLAATLAQQHFTAGHRAYQAQDFRAALTAYDAALAAGQTGPAIHFNIGVVAYRLGEYERALAEFREVARTPQMAALAHYNLGLVELKRRNQAAARAWFEQARGEAQDERLRALVDAQLEVTPAAPERHWVAYTGLGFGYDDNVALISNSEVLGVADEADEFAEITAAITGPLAGAWNFDAAVVATRYQALDDFNQLIAQGGSRYTFGRGPWTHAISAEVAHTQLGDEPFENRLSLGLQTSISLPHEWSARLRYRFSDLDGLDGFDGIDGTRHELRARVRTSTEASDLSFEYGYETSDYRDDALSANQHKLTAAYERVFLRDWRAGLDAAVRFSNYELGSHGNEDRIEVGASLKKQLTATWRIGARYDYANNDAQLGEFDYRRNRIWIGAEAVL